MSKRKVKYFAARYINEPERVEIVRETAKCVVRDDRLNGKGELGETFHLKRGKVDGYFNTQLEAWQWMIRDAMREAKALHEHAEEWERRTHNLQTIYWRQLLYAEKGDDHAKKA